MVPGRPSLQDLAPETLLQIMRHLVFDDDTVEFGPRQQHENGMPRRSLGILRVSKQFHNLSSSVLYGENCFVMSNRFMFHYHRFSHPRNGSDHNRKVLFNRNASDDCFARPYTTTGIKLLNILSIAAPAQSMLKRISITASDHIMDAFYDYTLLVILTRMRALQLLHFCFIEEETGNGLRFFEGDGEGPESNGRKFMGIVNRELAHVKEVTVEDSTVSFRTTVYDIALQQVLSELDVRNREWKSSEQTVVAFWGTFVGKDEWIRGSGGLS